MSPRPCATELLSRLVAFAPVAGRPNDAIADWVSLQLTQAGARVTRIPSAAPERVNLFATFGPAEGAGIVLSGHMDVVPAEPEGWTSAPFVLSARDARLYGRGSSDMLGFLATVLAVAPDICALVPDRPVHVALSCDEELGCLGVPALLARLPDLCAPPRAALIGEPTGLVPVRGHKGKAALALEVLGRAGHSARPELGLNAIHGMAPVLNEVIALAARLQRGPLAADFVPPCSTVQAGVISGGQAVNIIPERARLEVEARAIPGVDPMELLAPVLERLRLLEAEGFRSQYEVRATYPAMTIAADHPFVRQVEAASGHAATGAVSFGTEGGLFQQAGIPAVICGPGDIGRAHRPDEYITRDELAQGEVFLRRLLQQTAQD